MALRFENPASFILSGASGVGKTFWMIRFVKHLKEICSEINRVIYHYEVWQKVFNEYTNEIDFYQGPPSLESLKEAKNALVILDDLMHMDSTFLAKIFCVYSHHHQFTVMMTVQNLFHKGLREISLNAQFIILFKNCRDLNQIAYFMRQLYPKNYKEALEAYKDAVSAPRGYLLVDLRVETDDKQRLRTNIFPGEINYLYQ